MQANDDITTSTEAVSAARSSASPSSKRAGDPAASAARRAVATIPGAMSTPVTEAPAAAASIARSPIAATDVEHLLARADREQLQQPAPRRADHLRRTG